ncbi:sulfotransferase [Candidatus Woesebacteria bacterium]|jgi:hypothetical protein|nr:MAG: sulfotransferase [Candidatus Woesebacteria bacterium]
MIEGLPDFLVVGAAKSGTTSLYYYLKEHPSIYLSHIKEVWFFSFKDNPPQDGGPASLGEMIITNSDEYRKLFVDAKPNQLGGDICPSYLYTHLATVKNIKEVYGSYHKKLKIIICLRNPIDRAYSQYMMFKRDNNEPLSFEKALKPEIIQERLNNGWNFFYDYISFGMYYQQVITFLQEFPNTKVVLFDDFVRSPDSILMELMGFLEIEKTYLDAARDFRYNVSGIPKYRKLDYFVSEANLLKSLLKPVMNKMMSKDARYKLKNLIRNTYIVKPSMKRETRNRLISIYKEDISRLQSLLGRDLSNWTSMES